MTTTTITSNAALNMPFANFNSTNFTSDVVVESTKNTPFVKYNPKIQKLTIVGSSFIEQADTFYEPFLSRIYDDLFEKNQATLEINLTSFGPKTAKILFEMFGNLRTFSSAGKSIDIIWKASHEDEHIAELGLSFAELFDLKIQVVQA